MQNATVKKMVYSINVINILEEKDEKRINRIWQHDA